MGRVVITHSSYIKGLIPKLELLAKDDKIQTITPGRIKKTKGKREDLNLRVTTKILGGYKLISRKGTCVQEVFIVTDLDKESLEAKIELSS